MDNSNREAVGGELEVTDFGDTSMKSDTIVELLPPSCFFHFANVLGAKRFDLQNSSWVSELSLKAFKIDCQSSALR